MSSALYFQKAFTYLSNLDLPSCEIGGVGVIPVL